MIDYRNVLPLNVYLLINIIEKYFDIDIIKGYADSEILQQPEPVQVIGTSAAEPELVEAQESATAQQEPKKRPRVPEYETETEQSQTQVSTTSPESTSQPFIRTSAAEPEFVEAQESATAQQEPKKTT